MPRLRFDRERQPEHFHDHGFNLECDCDRWHGEIAGFVYGAAGAVVEV